MERIREIFEELNFPGAERLKKALKNRGIPFTKEQVNELTKGESVRQVQQAALPLTGKVASHYENYEWQADLIDWTTASSNIKGERFILVVQDVFSRKIWAEAMMTKQPAEVQRAFKRIIDRANVLLPPNRLTTDAGGEFADVKKYMERNRRTYRVRKSLRSLATIDNAIGLLKKALARDLRKHRQMTGLQDYRK